MIDRDDFSGCLEALENQPHAYLSVLATHPPHPTEEYFKNTLPNVGKLNAFEELILIFK